MPKCGGFLHKMVPILRLETIADWLGRSILVPVDHGEGWCNRCEAVIHA